jgi:hypothetical protein
LRALRLRDWFPCWIYFSKISPEAKTAHDNKNKKKNAHAGIKKKKKPWAKLRNRK